MYIDTHAHLTDKRYGGAESIIKDFKADGIDFIVNVGYDTETTAASYSLAEKYDTVYAAAGIHPFDASTVSWDALKTVERYAARARCVAVGEIGLDYHYDNVKKERQHMFFTEQMKIADKLNKPIIIHRRDDAGDVLKIFKENKSLLRCGGVMHSFMESAEDAAEFTKLGFYISFSGALTFKKGLAETLKSVPLDRVMFETDCPYLTPEPHRGKLNYPAYVKYVYEYAARVLDLSVESTARIAAANVRRCFNI